MSDPFARLPLLAVLLTACGSPADKKLTKENLEALNKSKALTGEELQLLQGYVLRTGMASAFAGKGAEGILDSSVTIRQAIDKQRQWATDDSIRTSTEAAAAAEAVSKYECRKTQGGNSPTRIASRTSTACHSALSWVSFAGYPASKRCPSPTTPT